MADKTALGYLQDEKPEQFNRHVEQQGGAVDLQGAHLRSYDLRKCNLSQADLRGAYMRATDLRALDLSEAQLEGASIKDAKISGVQFPRDVSANEISLSVTHGTRIAEATPAHVPTFTCADILAATGGNWINPSDTAPTTCGPLSTDTRTLGAGQWFIPIVGERFNGHDYLQQAADANVAGCLVQHDYIDELGELATGSIPIIAVPNTTLAYLAIAGWHRQHRCADTVVIGVTGSSGKTTVKEMLVAALSPYKTVVATAKNFNNDIGVAQTLLGCPPQTDILIVEMGMRGLGEIERLSLAARPNIAIITTVGSAHIGRLGSKQAIAKAKAEIVAGLTPHLVVPTSPLFIYPQQANLLQPFLDALPPIIQQAPFEVTEGAVTSPAPGQHMQANTNAVAMAGVALGLSAQQIQQGLNNYAVPQGRGNVVTLQTSPRHVLISDAYNANPESMAASLHQFFAEYGTPNTAQVAVLAGMKEQGDFAEDAHQAIGQLWKTLQASTNNSASLWLIGDEFKLTATQLIDDDVACQWLPMLPQQGTAMDDVTKAVLLALPLNAAGALLLKGSRAYGLDMFEQALQTHYAPNPAATV